LRGALTKRPDGFLYQITTQSKQAPTGIFASELDMARKVRDGKIEMPLLPVLYELPDKQAKDWKNRKYWPCVNPNLGRSTNEDFLAREIMRAETEGAASTALIASQHFNVQIGIALRSDGWAGAEVWERGIDLSLTLDEILRRSEVVTIGIDGGGLDDLLGVGLIGREKETHRWLGWAHALISDIGMERRKANAEDYAKFERDGSLTKFRYVRPVDGEPLPPRDAGRQYIVDLVKRVHDLGLLAQVGVDAAGIGSIVDDLAELGITQDAETLDSVRQGIGLMGAIKTIEIKLADYSFRHDGCAMLKWCVGNLRVIPTRTAMMVARDEAGFGKVDPAMALFNASHLMGLNPTAARKEYQMFFV
jgi:phage terminase large subunit-like protein